MKSDKGKRGGDCPYSQTTLVYTACTRCTKKRRRDQTPSCLPSRQSSANYLIEALSAFAIERRRKHTVSATQTLSFLSFNKLATSAAILLIFSGGNAFAADMANPRFAPDKKLFCENRIFVFERRIRINSQTEMDRSTFSDWKSGGRFVCLSYMT